MTRQLLLLRHAKSSWADPSIADHERPLSQRGRKAAAAMRQMMLSEGINPDIVLASTARRTRETLEALQPWPHPPVVAFDETLYLASASRMLALLRNAKESARTILLVGHNPGLQDLALLLAGRHEMAVPRGLAQRLANAYPTGALAQLDVQCPWSEIAEGSGKLTQFVIPRELKAAE